MLHRHPMEKMLSQSGRLMNQAISVGLSIPTTTRISNAKKALHSLITVRITCPRYSVFSALISSLDMPVCDGVEACKRIRTLESRRKVPHHLPSESFGDLSHLQISDLRSCGPECRLSTVSATALSLRGNVTFPDKALEKG